MVWGFQGHRYRVKVSVKATAMRRGFELYECVLVQITLTDVLG